MKPTLAILALLLLSAACLAATAELFPSGYDIRRINVQQGNFGVQSDILDNVYGQIRALFIKNLGNEDIACALYDDDMNTIASISVAANTNYSNRSFSNYTMLGNLNVTCASNYTAGSSFAGANLRERFKFDEGSGNVSTGSVGSNVMELGISAATRNFSWLSGKFGSAVRLNGMVSASNATGTILGTKTCIASNSTTGACNGTDAIGGANLTLLELNSTATGFNATVNISNTSLFGVTTFGVNIRAGYFPYVVNNTGPVGVFLWNGSAWIEFANLTEHAFGDINITGLSPTTYAPGNITRVLFKHANPGTANNLRGVVIDYVALSTVTTTAASGAYFRMNASADVNFTAANKLTLAGWFNVSQPATNKSYYLLHQGLLAGNASGNGTNATSVVINNATSMTFRVRTNNSVSSLTYNAASAWPSTFQHFAFVANATYMAIYHNGTLVANTTYANSTLASSSAPYYFGDGFDVNTITTYAQGAATYDELSIFNTTLSATQISYLNGVNGSGVRAETKVVIVR